MYSNLLLLLLLKNSARRRFRDRRFTASSCREVSFSVVRVRNTRSNWRKVLQRMYKCTLENIYSRYLFGQYLYKKFRWTSNTALLQAIFDRKSTDVSEKNKSQTSVIFFLWFQPRNKNLLKRPGKVYFSVKPIQTKTSIQNMKRKLVWKQKKFKIVFEHKSIVQILSLKHFYSNMYFTVTVRAERVVFYNT